jgi:hypothetical protein
VTFYPFLVITERPGGRAAWLPFWHIIGEREELKYGECPPYMELQLFVDLVTQARDAGYLKKPEEHPATQAAAR